jgi:hypothetical protein
LVDFGVYSEINLIIWPSNQLLYISPQNCILNYHFLAIAKLLGLLNVFQNTVFLTIVGFIGIALCAIAKLLGLLTMTDSGVVKAIALLWSAGGRF